MESQLANFIDTFSKWRPQDFVERNVIGLNCRLNCERITCNDAE